MARNFGTQKKAKLWLGLPGGQTGMTADGTFIESALAFTSPQTVLRMIGEYTIVPVATPVAADAVVITVAIGKVSSDAFAVGATAVPDPGDEPGYPWLYWASHALKFPTADADPSGMGGTVRRSFDVRTMRKFTAQESLIWVFEYADLTGAPAMTIALGETRVLTTLH